jgi:putative transposase
MDEAKTEVLAFTAFPRNHWPKVWSTNPLERVNKEIKRRARVVGIFSQPARRHPPRRRHLGRHARRMAGQRPPLPIRRLHGPTQTDQQ